MVPYVIYMHDMDIPNVYAHEHAQHAGQLQEGDNRGLKKSKQFGLLSLPEGEEGRAEGGQPWDPAPDGNLPDLSHVEGLD